MPLYSYPYLNQQKPLVPSYYCLYSLYNKIRDKGKIVSGWVLRGGVGGGGVGGKGVVGAGGRNEPSLVCTYE